MFDLPRAPSSVKSLGADALEWLADRPDLSLLRARQLLEVFMTLSELDAGIVYGESERPTLRSRGLDAKERGHLPQRLFNGLKSVIEDCNAAVHANTIRRIPASAHAQPAQDAVLFAAKIWAHRSESPEPTELSYPVSLSEAVRARLQGRAFLERAEEDVRAGRDSAAEVLLTRVRALASIDGMASLERDLLLAHCESVELAIRNHRGQSPRALDEARLARLAASARGDVRELVVRLCNRRAVARTNNLDLEGARVALEPLLQGRALEVGGRPASLSEYPVRDYLLGALNGTMGLTWALTAHAQADPEYLELAQDHFTAARELFDQDSDKERHRTNELHSLIERVRLGGDLSGTQAAQLDRLMESNKSVAALVEARERESWRDPAAFHVAAALKGCALTERLIPWRKELFRALEVIDHDTVLPHPYVQVVGWTLLLESAAPARLRRSLQHTAAAARAPLIRWIAESFLSPEEPVAPPAQLRAWWDAHSPAAEPRTGPVRWLPFNYA